MAGHSKWANIKRHKGAQDAKRGKVFTKIIREITVAARMGGGDPAFNPRLRLAVDKGIAANMPKDNVERAIKRGTGELEGTHYEEVTYEGYGPGGVALLIRVLTDNRNRTGSEIRHIFSRNGGNLAEPNAVAWMFSWVEPRHRRQQPRPSHGTRWRCQRSRRTRTSREPSSTTTTFPP